MSLKRIMADDRTKKAALLFFLACEANPDTRLSIPAAMRAKGYSDVEAADQILVQQVRHESQKINPKILLVPSLWLRRCYWPWQLLQGWQGRHFADKGMGSTMMMSGRVSKEWDDDQTTWDA
jgi:hypothetical protein